MAVIIQAMGKDETTNKEVEGVLDALKKDAESIRECEAIAKRINVSKVYKLTVKVGDEDSPTTATAFFRKPTRQVFAAAVAKQQRDPQGAKELLLRSMFIEGDTNVYEDDYAFMCASLYVDDMIGLVYGELKKN